MQYNTATIILRSHQKKTEKCNNETQKTKMISHFSFLVDSPFPYFLDFICMTNTFVSLKSKNKKKTQKHCKNKKNRKTKTKVQTKKEKTNVLPITAITSHHYSFYLKKKKKHFFHLIPRSRAFVKKAKSKTISSRLSS